MNLSSGAGRFCAPNQVPYTASKHALEAACETLAHEVVRFGIHVSIIEPGIVATAIFENSAPMTRFDKTSPYRDLMRRSGKVYKAPYDPSEFDPSAARSS